MHCPCCCTAKGGGGIGTAIVLGLAIYLATRSATVMAAIHAFLITVLVGEVCLTAILITTIVLVIRSNRPVPLTRPVQTVKAEIVERPVHVITSAPTRPVAAPVASELLEIEPPRTMLNGEPWKLERPVWLGRR